MNLLRPSRFALALSIVLVACSSPESPAPEPLVPGQGSFGDSCTATEDCESLLCVRVNGARGVCTRACASDTDCPGSSNWICARPSGRLFSLCACDMSASAEVCGDGLDNDCDGRVDDCLMCGGKAVAPDDHANCGVCGHECRLDQQCRDGACVCFAGRTECGGKCTDLESDNAHCGECGSQCGPGQTCVDGTCACTDAELPDYCPGDGCVDFRSNGGHCGSCGNACPAQQSCVDGLCVCPPGDARDYCQGAGCVDLGKDPEHCGGCAKACGAGQSCDNGDCKCPTSSLPDYCPSVGCIDLSSDPHHCGNCNTACGMGEVCKAGACVCPANAPDQCPGTGCVNLDQDPGNCGACGLPCTGGMACIDGTCSCPATAPTWCGSSCTDLLADESSCGACGVKCGASQACVAGQCVCSGAGSTACGTACVDTKTDEANCGACGWGCLAGESCYGGNCTCGSNLYCDGTCVGSNDPQNCGGCGLTCGTAQVCQGGACKCSTAGLAACGTACVDLKTDEANCAACGLACKAGQSCTGSVCSCPAGQKWCLETGTCTAILTDKAHCGDCGLACPDPQNCVSGLCSCPVAAQIYCASEGACVDKATSAKHCGKCDNACLPTQVCTYGSCKCPVGGQQFCASAGACVDTLADAAHCGGCDKACPVASQCVNGTCKCDAAGELVCNGTCVNPKTHHDNCGACGKSCAGTTQCIDSLCSCPPAPVQGPTRLTSTATSTRWPVAASAGDKVGVVYFEVTKCANSSLVNNLSFALLADNGTLISDIALTSHVCGGSARVMNEAVDLVWTGSEFGVVWQDYAFGNDGWLMFRRVDAHGGLLGPAVDVTKSTPGGVGYAAKPGIPRVAYTPEAGYALLSSGDLQRLGMDGTQIEPAVDLSDVTSDAKSTIAGSPVGWGLLYKSGLTETRFKLVNLDGSSTSSYQKVGEYQDSTRPWLYWDGSTWLAFFGDTIKRGAHLEHTQVLTSVAGSRRRAVLLGDILAISAVSTTSTIPLYRFRVPQGLTEPIESLGAPVELLTTPNVDVGEAHSLAGTTGKKVVGVWSDTRYGAFLELLSAGTDLSGCP